ncbi:MSMEG_1061 family FMN-dependent PPOX-type flavoprotein [Thalassotalea sp. PS06]|uniref:MSMEG_1061 family FMN-dependent PPOX-type flavoprotein n=1 Tax=Thalassotalea sp. PS06 TaxID=2594005 RepID=UPI00116359F4|nr:MSMEG_1061 family FMN-dependent PPOX-type flavoprotein [Thalassotalea sp. PS06]QDP02759.1 pyridoxamine 5'-phosphate oxidase family protein [Thalassotalea sp. PS06]
MYKPTDIVTTEAEIREIVPNQFASQIGKVIDHIDDHLRTWIERTPFITMATVSKEGRVDVSPKGDPAGFVKVLDEKTLAVPDRPGNHRFDSFLNILETGRISLMFLVPNRREVVRVAGSAVVVRDQELRESMAVNGKVPDFAVVVTVEEAFFHCGKSVIRSKLWEPEKALPVDGLSTYAQAVKDHAALETPLVDIETAFANNEKNRLYDE